MICTCADKHDRSAGSASATSAAPLDSSHAACFFWPQSTARPSVPNVSMYKFVNLRFVWRPGTCAALAHSREPVRAQRSAAAGAQESTRCGHAPAKNRRRSATSRGWRRTQTCQKPTCAAHVCRSARRARACPRCRRAGSGDWCRRSRRNREVSHGRPASGRDGTFGGVADVARAQLAGLDADALCCAVKPLPLIARPGGQASCGERCVASITRPARTGVVKAHSRESEPLRQAPSGCARSSSKRAAIVRGPHEVSPSSQATACRFIILYVEYARATGSCAARQRRQSRKRGRPFSLELRWARATELRSAQLRSSPRPRVLRSGRGLGAQRLALRWGSA